MLVDKEQNPTIGSETLLSRVRSMSETWKRLKVGPVPTTTLLEKRLKSLRDISHRDFVVSAVTFQPWKSKVFPSF